MSGKMTVTEMLATLGQQVEHHQERQAFHGQQETFHAEQEALPALAIGGCLQFSNPAWRMAARDRWIGWSEAQRRAHLPEVVQHSRFLLLPWVRIAHLASHVLARAARQLSADWQERFGVRPLLLETLVDAQLFSGTCYRAANWIALGETTGRGRQDRSHQKHGSAPKRIFVFPLAGNARRLLGASR